MARPLLPDQEEIDRLPQAARPGPAWRARLLAPLRRVARAVVSWIVDIS